MSDARIQEALSSRRGQRAFVRQLDIMVRAPVRIALRMWPSRAIGVQDEDDVVAEIFEKLFEADGRDLRKWDAARGSLEHYVAMYARHRVKDLEKKEMRRRELIPPAVPLDEAAEVVDLDRPDNLVMAQEAEARVRRCLGAKLATPRAQEMLRLLYDRRLTTDELQEMGHERQAVSRWRAMIRKCQQECFLELQTER